jgi:hypothetical protein
MVLVAIAVAIVVLLSLIANSVWGAARSAPVVTEQCMDDEQRERVRGIVLQGIEAGLKDQVKHVYEIWMKDDSEQPKRAIAGMHIGIRAYVHSRAQALKWSPPKCEEASK